MRNGFIALVGLLAAGCTEADPDFIEPDTSVAGTDSTTADGTESGDGTSSSGTADATDTADTTDTGPNCGADEMLCGADCINPQNNKNHCGMCDHKCQGPSKCVDGTCD
jgi:hypothetical protein